MWTSPGIALKTKLKLFNAIVLSILLYGSETWKGLKEIEHRLRIFERNCLRRIMSIKCYEHITEEEVRRRSGQQGMVQKLRHQRWRYYGHVLRMGEERLLKQVLSWTPEGSRQRKEKFHRISNTACELFYENDGKRQIKKISQ